MKVNDIVVLRTLNMFDRKHRPEIAEGEIGIVTVQTDLSKPYVFVYFPGVQNDPRHAYLMGTCQLEVVP